MQVDHSGHLLKFFSLYPNLGKMESTREVFLFPTMKPLPQEFYRKNGNQQSGCIP